MALIEPGDGTSIPGISLPSELYWVLRSPAPLAGMRYPRADLPWNTLAEAGFGGLVSLHPGDYDPSPLVCLLSRHLEDLYHGQNPRDAGKEKRLISEAADVIVRTLRSGQGVVVHCAGGTGRTGTVIGCALRRLGYEGTEVVRYLDRLHKARGKQGWPESPWQKAVVESFGVSGRNTLRTS